MMNRPYIGSPYLSVLFLLLALQVQGQNLIPNNSFESNTAPPVTWQEMRKLTSWYNPVIGCEASSYFMEGAYLPSREIKGNVHPHSGKAFMGIAVDLKRGDEEVSQYLAVQLTEPLQKGRMYHISLYIRLCNHMHYAVDHLGAVFLKEKNIITGCKTLECESYVHLKGAGEAITNEKEWEKIEGTYTAEGGEQYVIFGGLTCQYQLQRMPFRPGIVYWYTRKITYYYVDDVSVEPVGAPQAADTLAHIDPKASQAKPEASTYILSDFTFAVNSAVIRQEFRSVLDSIVLHLQNNTSKQTVVINGYTDSSGDATANKQLSENRAKAVKDYFISKGISADIITCYGYGSDQPLADNATDEGRSKNRRVEVIVR
jgi:OOP family OmpA-OmpF porin